MSNPAPSQPPALPQPEGPAHSAKAGSVSEWKVMWLVLESIIAFLLLGLGYAAYQVGMLMNFVFVLLILLTFFKVIGLLARFWRKQVYFGLLTAPRASATRPYWWALTARITFYLCCGWLLQLAIVPYQFPDLAPYTMTIGCWALVLFLIPLSLLPAKRISPVRILFLLSASAFFLWQFVQIRLPAGQTDIVLGSPLKGVTCVVQGGNSPLINHHYQLTSQRYAVDLFKVAETREQVAQWQIWKGEASLGQTVYSPCDGRIAYVENGHHDNAVGQTDADHPAGNHLTIEVAKDRYVLLAHLKENSLLVKPGDVVKTGQPLAQCGNSGNTSMAHVHLQLQTTPQFSYETTALPIAFRKVLRGDTPLDNLAVRRNDLLLSEN